MACKQVVLVEPDEALRDAFQLFLGGRGYDVMVFGETSEALDHLVHAAEWVGLVVVEPAMPDAAGFELLARRALHPELNRVPFAVLTTLDVQRLGASPDLVAVLRKPVDCDVLLELVRRYCGTPVHSVARPTGRSEVGARRPSSSVPRPSGTMRIFRGADFDEWLRTQRRRPG